MNIGFYDPFVKSGYEKTIGIKKFDNLIELTKFSNVISINCVLNNETKGMINNKFLKDINLTGGPYLKIFSPAYIL